MKVQRAFVEMGNYGAKLCVKFNYSKTMVSRIKELEWDDTHRFYDRKRNLWTFDAKVEVLLKLINIGLDIPLSVKDKIIQLNQPGNLVKSRLSGTDIVYSFKYNKELIDIIKEIVPAENRDYDTFNKEWVITPTPEIVALLRHAEFPIPTDRPTNFHYEVKLVAKGSKIKIMGSLPSIILDEMDRVMSYEASDAKYTKRYIDGKWDGITKLFNKRTQVFPIGLLPDAENILSNFNTPFTVEDNRKDPKKAIYKWSGVTLRDYQMEAVRSAIKYEFGTISMPTGSGKTEVGFGIIRYLSTSAIILVHRKELLYQWLHRTKETLGLSDDEVGIWGDGHRTEGKVTIASFQTLMNNPTSKEYGLILVDEVHNVPADNFSKIVPRYECKYRFGLTATAFRDDGKDLLIWGNVGNIIYEVDVVELVKKGYLAKPLFKNLFYGKIQVKSKEWYSAYKELIEMEERNNAIAAYASYLNKRGYKVYVDVMRVKHGQLLAERIEMFGQESTFLSGKSKKDVRRYTIEEFETSNFILVSTLIKEGVNLPKMSVIILAGGWKSRTIVIQAIGRGLRPKKPENVALVVNLRDHGSFAGKHFYDRCRVMKNYYKELYEPKTVKYKGVE